MSNIDFTITHVPTVEKRCCSYYHQWRDDPKTGKVVRNTGGGRTHFHPEGRGRRIKWNAPKKSNLYADTYKAGDFASLLCQAHREGVRAGNEVGEDRVQWPNPEKTYTMHLNICPARGRLVSFLKRTGFGSARRGHGWFITTTELLNKYHWADADDKVFGAESGALPTPDQLNAYAYTFGDVLNQAGVVDARVLS